jgi:hypothetical protein
LSVDPVRLEELVETAVDVSDYPDLPAVCRDILQRECVVVYDFEVERLLRHVQGEGTEVDDRYLYVPLSRVPQRVPPDLVKHVRKLTLTQHAESRLIADMARCADNDSARRKNTNEVGARLDNNLDLVGSPTKPDALHQRLFVLLDAPERGNRHPHPAIIAIHSEFGDAFELPSEKFPGDQNQFELPSVERSAKRFLPSGSGSAQWGV